MSGIISDNVGRSSGLVKAVAAAATGSVRFHAQQETPQSISNSTETNVVFETEVIDEGSGYDTSTGYYTVPSGEGGTYSIYLSLHFGSGAGNIYIGRMYKSTDAGSSWSEIHQMWDYQGSGKNVTANSWLVVLSEADVLKTTITHNQSTTQSMFDADAGSAMTFFGGFKLV
tara:strand:+ start:31 stop:543 length:513 start_codon:yes stop_codon:yes gene_type:complete